MPSDGGNVGAGSGTTLSERYGIVVGVGRATCADVRPVRLDNRSRAAGGGSRRKISWGNILELVARCDPGTRDFVATLLRQARGDCCRGCDDNGPRRPQEMIGLRASIQ